MTKVLILLSYVFMITCCPSTPRANETKIIRYGYNNSNDTSKDVMIYLANYSSYKTLYTRIEQVTCNDSIPIIPIQKEINLLKLIHPLNPCWSQGAIQCMKKKNVLAIKDELILGNLILPLDSLESQITKHYNNCGRSPYYSEHPNKAIITIDYKEKGIAGLSDILDRITSHFDKTKYSDILALQFADHYAPIITPLPIKE